MPVDVTEVAPTVNGVGTVTVPVKVGEASGANPPEVNALVPSVPPLPILSVDKSVPASVNELLTVKVFDVVPPATANPVAFDVNVNPFIDVALAAPNVGVTNVGDVEKTRFVLVVPVVPVAAFK